MKCGSDSFRQFNSDVVALKLSNQTISNVADKMINWYKRKPWSTQRILIAHQKFIRSMCYHKSVWNEWRIYAQHRHCSKPHWRSRCFGFLSETPDDASWMKHFTPGHKHETKVNYHLPLTTQPPYPAAARLHKRAWHGLSFDFIIKVTFGCWQN